MSQTKLTLIGAGRMGSAMLGGWLSQGLKGQIAVFDPNPTDDLKALSQKGDIVLNAPATPAETLIIAVKPQIFGSAVDMIREHIGPQTKTLSIMAGVSLQTLEDRLQTTNVSRAIPNTPGLVGKGVTLTCFKPDTPETVRTYLSDLLRPLGAVEGPFEEDLLPAATAISGCGPAYGFLLAEVMAAAGEAHGIDPDLAQRLACKTVEGAGALMEASDDTAATLRQNVTSPNGVTQAALEVLMRERAMPSLFREAVEAAIARDRALNEETQ
ncbi:MAG: pyrroline-5-carboxylate reductase [Pseudomonadota bacterium]